MTVIFFLILGVHSDLINSAFRSLVVSAYGTSLMNPTFRSLVVSSAASHYLSSPNLFFLWATGLAFGSNTRLWQMTNGYIPSISAGV